ncbi:MAG: PadR family transcriptional regulator [Fimbriimonas sp.]
MMFKETSVAFRGDLEALILGALQRSPMHGYELAKHLKDAGSQVLIFGEGQLYPALHKLERDQFIEATWIPQEGRPSRKVYQLTEKGRLELARQQRSWKEFASAVGRVLGTPSPEAPSA